MSDDLVKRLRKADEYEPLGNDGWEAADRIEALEAQLAKAQAERSAYRAVLEGAGYGDIDTIGKQDPDLNRMLGMEVARLTILETEKAQARPGAVEVCPICDIAGCHHIRERQARPVGVEEAFTWVHAGAGQVKTDGPNGEIYCTRFGGVWHHDGIPYQDLNAAKSAAILKALSGEAEE